MWGISITMCYFHRFIDDINYSLQDFLITFFELLAWIVLIIGAIDTFPQNKYSYLQPIITQYFIDNKSEIWLLFLIAHSKR